VKATPITTPSVNIEGAITFCEGKQVKLTANQSSTFLSYQWTNGIDNPSITVDKTGQFSVKITDIYGCQSQSSATISTQKNTSPSKPTINNLSSKVFCEDSNVTLEVAQVSDKYVWSNGSNNRSIKVNTTSEYNVQVIDANGCASVKSDNIGITALPLPPTPTVTADAPTVFCEEKGVNLTASNEKAVKFSWNRGQSSRSIYVNKSDTLSIRTVDLFGCVSKPSLTVFTKSNPTPATPKITANGDTVFCEGKNVTLFSNKANPSHVTTWTITQEGITKDFRTEQFGVNTSGSFAVSVTDQNACVSKVSEKVFVSVKPNPDELNLIRLSPYTLQAQNQKTTSPLPTEYIWEFGTDNVPLKSKTLYQRIDQEGLYRVRARNIYPTRSYGEKICESKSTTPQRFLKYDDAGLSLFPNPNNGQFLIESPYPWEGTTVKVYDLLGRILYDESVGTMNNRKQISLNLASGEYIFEMKSASNFKFQKRLIIVR
jgi:Secretion system C-terminal sorting domain